MSDMSQPQPPQYDPYGQGVPAPVPEPGYPQAQMQQPVPQPAPAPMPPQPQPVPQPQPQPQPNQFTQQIIALVERQVGAEVDRQLQPIRQRVDELIQSVNQMMNWSGDAHTRLNQHAAAFDDVYQALVGLGDADERLKQEVVELLGADVAGNVEHVMEQWKYFVATEAVRMNVRPADLVKIKKALVGDVEDELDAMDVEVEGVQGGDT